MTRTRGLLLLGLLLALVLAGGVSYYASSAPDGLNTVSEDKGFSDRATEHGLADSPLAGYRTRGIGDARLSGGVAGIIGVVATFAIGGLVFTVLRRRKPAEGTAEGTAGTGTGAGTGTAAGTGTGTAAGTGGAAAGTGTGTAPAQEPARR